MPVDRAERLQRWDALEAPLLTPSLLDCDFARVGEVLRELEGAGVGAVHLDVMDGHFVPNLTYGAPVIADWRGATDLPFDAHLMMSEPARYLDDFIRAGCDLILFHIEAVPEPSDLIRRIQGEGCRAGLVLNPPTPLESVEPYLDRVDSLLVMSVMPGFGGQSFDPSSLEKVRRARKLHPNLWISIDGGLNVGTIGAAVSAGVSQWVAGSAVFRPGSDIASRVAELNRAARSARVDAR